MTKYFHKNKLHNSNSLSGKSHRNRYLYILISVLAIVALSAFGIYKIPIFFKSNTSKNDINLNNNVSVGNASHYAKQHILDNTSSSKWFTRIDTQKQCLCLSYTNLPNFRENPTIAIKQIVRSLIDLYSDIWEEGEEDKDYSFANDCIAYIKLGDNDRDDQIGMIVMGGGSIDSAIEDSLKSQISYKPAPSKKINHHLFKYSDVLKQSASFVPIMKAHIDAYLKPVFPLARTEDTCPVSKRRFRHIGHTKHFQIGFDVNALAAEKLKLKDEKDYQVSEQEKIEIKEKIERNAKKFTSKKEDRRNIEWFLTLVESHVHSAELEIWFYTKDEQSRFGSFMHLIRAVKDNDPKAISYLEELEWLYGETAKFMLKHFNAPCHLRSASHNDQEDCLLSILIEVHGVSYSEIEQKIRQDKKLYNF